MGYHTLGSKQSDEKTGFRDTWLFTRNFGDSSFRSQKDNAFNLRRASMKNHWLKLCVVAFAFSVFAKANHDGAKAPAMSGSFEGGIGHSWNPAGTLGATNGAQYFVDGLHLKNRFEVSPKVSVVLHNAFAVNSKNVGPGGVHNGSAYFSNATLTFGNPSFSFSNLAAYIQHECSKNVTMSFGHMRTALGMESMWDRVNMGTYYYSPVYTFGQGMGMNYDLGLKFRISDVVPGSLEIALVDGRAGRTSNTFGGVNARWHYEYKNGETSITPVVSTLLENWRGGPTDVAITAGAMMKFSSLWLNAEWNYLASTNVNFISAGGQNKAWQAMVEPGFDLGMFDLSVKYNFLNGSVGTAASKSDHSIGAAISKTYDEKYRIKLAYNHSNLSGNFGAHVNDVRMLFSTNW